MGRWCMYLSVNGADIRSVIVLLTATDLTGDWTYVGPVVYSGFSREDIGRTDADAVLHNAASAADGATAARILDLSRYGSRKDTRINAIDAAPVWDGDDLWLAFGSWFGGIWMLRLDPATGLRDTATHYPLERDAAGESTLVDPYYGVKIAGGYWNTGEGAYLVRHGDWWHLMLSYGWLGRTGGYQIRQFRARSPLGPFVDMAGNPAVSAGEMPHNEVSRTGLRMLSTVQWDDDVTESAQGHNSVLVRDDGRMFLVYHTRFADPARDDPNDFEMRVRELATTADDWLAAAPLPHGGTDSRPIRADEVAGTWDVVIHDPATVFIDEGGTGINRPDRVVLHANGRVTRGGAVSFSDTYGETAARMTDGAPTCGTWRTGDDTSDILLRLDGRGYRLRGMATDGSPARVMLTGAGDNQAIWAIRRG